MCQVSLKYLRLSFANLYDQFIGRQFASPPSQPQKVTPVMTDSKSVSQLEQLCIRLGLTRVGDKKSESELIELLTKKRGTKRSASVFDAHCTVRPCMSHSGVMVVCPNLDGKHIIKLRRVTLCDVGTAHQLDQKRQKSGEFLDQLFCSIFDILGTRFGAWPLQQDEIDQ